MKTPFAPVALGDNAEVRYTRLSGTVSSLKNDHRSPAQRDRDRILYSTAFRRLGEVTQVAPTERATLFHNRLTHTLKVAQVGRRTAERLLTSDANEINLESIALANSLGGLDPDVVEAAGLAHDLGHPPFGHITEELLDEIIRGKCPGVASANGIHDGYEGNAQSFRIVTRLAMREEAPHETEQYGLDLTLATLNALLKYPHCRGEHEHEKAFRKFGFYRISEAERFEKCRYSARCVSVKTLEAELMDWSDDVAYAVYDLEDFYKVGLIPLDRLLEDATTNGDRGLDSVLNRGRELAVFHNNVKERWTRQNRPEVHSLRDHFEVFLELLQFVSTLGSTALTLMRPYASLDVQRVALRRATSWLVNRYALAVELNPDAASDPKLSPIKIKSNRFKREVTLLKELTWAYVIENPELVGIQFGQKTIIKYLTETFLGAADRREWSLFPIHVRERALQRKDSLVDNPGERIRLVADIVSSLTEGQAIDIYQRLTGHRLGSIMTRIL